MEDHKKANQLDIDEIQLEIKKIELELEKLKKENIYQLEIDKAKLELKKVELDIEKTKKEINNKFLKFENIFKFISFLILGIPLIVLLYNEFALPMARKESLVAQLETIENRLITQKKISELDSIIRNKELKIRLLSDEYAINQLAIKNEFDSLKMGYDSFVLNNPNFKNKGFEKFVNGKQAQIEKNVNKEYIIIKSNLEKVKNIRLVYNSFSNFQELLNFVYLNYLNESVEPYTYGKSWTLSINNKIIEKRGTLDERSLGEVGILPGKNIDLQLLR